MAKKRARRRTTRRKGPTRRDIKSEERFIHAAGKRVNVALRNLFLFMVLALVSYMLYKILNNSLFVSLFSLLTIIFAFVALAFFIVLLVFLALKIAKKREENIDEEVIRRRHHRRRKR
jgi:Ca2+/Na+ antiporter